MNVKKINKLINSWRKNAQMSAELGGQKTYESTNNGYGFTISANHKWASKFDSVENWPAHLPLLGSHETSDEVSPPTACVSIASLFSISPFHPTGPLLALKLIILTN